VGILTEPSIIKTFMILGIIILTKSDQREEKERLPNLDNGSSEVHFFGPSEVFVLPLGIAGCFHPQQNNFKNEISAHADGGPFFGLES
jgi:hypothetical protein